MIVFLDSSMHAVHLARERHLFPSQQFSVGLYLSLRATPLIKCLVYFTRVSVQGRYFYALFFFFVVVLCASWLLRKNGRDRGMQKFIFL